MEHQIRIRPHNDDPNLVVIEIRSYNGNCEDPGELIQEDVVSTKDMWATARKLRA
jgi:hypothetical protein